MENITRRVPTTGSRSSIREGQPETNSDSPTQNITTTSSTWFGSAEIKFDINRPLVDQMQEYCQFGGETVGSNPEEALNFIKHFFAMSEYRVHFNTEAIDRMLTVAYDINRTGFDLVGWEYPKYILVQQYAKSMIHNFFKLNDRSLISANCVTIAYAIISLSHDPRLSYEARRNPDAMNTYLASIDIDVESNLVQQFHRFMQERYLTLPQSAKEFYKLNGFFYIEKIIESYNGHNAPIHPSELIRYFTCIVLAKIFIKGADFILENKERLERDVADLRELIQSDYKISDKSPHYSLYHETINEYRRKIGTLPYPKRTIL